MFDRDIVVVNDDNNNKTPKNKKSIRYQSNHQYLLIIFGLAHYASRSNSIGTASAAFLPSPSALLCRRTAANHNRHGYYSIVAKSTTKSPYRFLPFTSFSSLSSASPLRTKSTINIFLKKKETYGIIITTGSSKNQTAEQHQKTHRISSTVSTTYHPKCAATHPLPTSATLFSTSSNPLRFPCHPPLLPTRHLAPPPPPHHRSPPPYPTPLSPPSTPPPTPTITSTFSSSSPPPSRLSPHHPPSSSPPVSLVNRC